MHHMILALFLLQCVMKFAMSQNAYMNMEVIKEVTTTSQWSAGMYGNHSKEYW